MTNDGCENVRVNKPQYISLNIAIIDGRGVSVLKKRRYLKETSKHTYWVIRRQSKGIPNGFKKAVPTHEPAAAWWIFGICSSNLLGS